MNAEERAVKLEFPFEDQLHEEIMALRADIATYVETNAKLVRENGELRKALQTIANYEAESPGGWGRTMAGVARAALSSTQGDGE